MLNLLKLHPAILSYSFMVVFFSGVGQTFLVAQFIPHIQSDLSLDRSEISFVYSLATLLASFNLSWIGKRIDITPILKFALTTVSFVGIALFILSLTDSIYILFLGLFLLRVSGQVTLALMATTAIAKLFGPNRGKALALVGLGKSAGEGVLPTIVVGLIAVFSWRGTYLTLGIAVLSVLIPLSFLILKNLDINEPYYEDEIIRDDASPVEWGWAQLFHDKHAALVMFTNGIMPFVLTGLFFQQATLSEAKNWSMELIATAFMAYSVANILGNFLWGYLIDRFSAVKIMPFVLTPLIIALFFLYCFSTTWACYVYMIFVGFGVGLSSLVRNTFWAEAYSTEILGGIKGMDSLFLVVGTATAPTIYALLLDFGVNFNVLVAGLIVLCAAGATTHLYLGHHYGQRLHRKIMEQNGQW